MVCSLYLLRHCSGGRSRFRLVLGPLLPLFGSTGHGGSNRGRQVVVGGAEARRMGRRARGSRGMTRCNRSVEGIEVLLANWGSRWLRDCCRWFSCCSCFQSMGLHLLTRFGASIGRTGKLLLCVLNAGHDEVVAGGCYREEVRLVARMTQFGKQRRTYQKT